MQMLGLMTIYLVYFNQFSNAKCSEGKCKYGLNETIFLPSTYLNFDGS